MAVSFRYEGRHHPGIGGRLPQESANAGYGADSGPSRGDPCTRALRPIETPKAATSFVRLHVNSVETYGPPRLQGVLSRSAADQSATTYPASEVSPGQDGDTRAPVLINSSASCAVFNIGLPERRLTVRPSRCHPLANLACTTGAFTLRDRTNSTRPRIPPWRQTVSRAASPPRRSSPACCRRRPRRCDGSCSSAKRAPRCPMWPSATRRLHGSAACAGICCRAC